MEKFAKRARKTKMVYIRDNDFIGYKIKCPTTTPVTDTLQWLKTNIEQRKNLFINKPLRVLLDSLKELKSGIIEYLGPEWYSVGNLNDTIWTKGINLYKVRFTQPVIFLRKWWSYNSDTLGSDEWLPIVERLYKNAIVKDVKVDEY